jgi:heptosyltransferase-2
MTQLVIFAPNWLGDAVMALPAIAAVRHARRDWRIAIAARPAVAPLFDLVPGVESLTLPRGARLDAGAPAFDAALLLPNSFKSALIAWRAGVPERWGYRTDCRGRLLTRAVPRPPEALHQADYYRRLVHALGFDAASAGPPRLETPAPLRAAGAERLRAAGWDGRAPLAALAPGAAYGGAKKWPPRHFAQLAAGLARDGVAAVLIGSAADAPAGAELLAGLGATGAPPPLNLIGQTDLPALAGVLANCRALVTNDSGAMHFAAALGVRVVAMFGPTDERATRPLGEGHAVLTHAVWCRPCMLRECPLDHRCMRGIDVEDVLAAARAAL